MRVHRRLALAFLVAAGLFACGSAGPAGGAREAALVGSFVFSCSGCPQNTAGASLYTVNAPGIGFRRLTLPDVIAPYHPAWSPTGRKIAVTNAFTEIWTIDANGGALRRVTQTRGEPSDDYPAWSPNGRQILFSRLGSLYAVRSDGSPERRLLSPPPHRSFVSPDWSPDGRRIVFERTDGRLYVMRADGSGAKRIGPRGFEARFPRWSPDGKRIAFIALRPTDPAVMVMRANGSRARVVIGRSDLNFNVNLAWAPDGRRIAFVVETPFEDEDIGGNQIVTVRPDGSDQRRVVIPELPPDAYSEIYGIDWIRRR